MKHDLEASPKSTNETPAQPNTERSHQKENILRDLTCYEGWMASSQGKPQQPVSKNLGQDATTGSRNPVVSLARSLSKASNKH